MRIGLLSFAAAAADKTENFYKNGPEQISSDFTTIVTNSDINEAAKARFIKKIENLSGKIQSKHDGLKAEYDITFPALDGDLEVDAINDVDTNYTCEAMSLIKQNLKNWATFFVEAAVRECNGSRCFTPNDGPLASLTETHQNWHNRNTDWVKKFNEKVDSLMKKTRIALVCGK